MKAECTNKGEKMQTPSVVLNDKKVLNQIELHPAFQQKELRGFHSRHNIATQAWSPLGQGTLLANPQLEKIAAAHGKTTAQIILRWHIETGNIVIPKSQSVKRMAENFDIFNFSLSPADHEAIATLDRRDGRISPELNPDSFN